MVVDADIAAGISYLRDLFPPTKTEFFGISCFKDSFALFVQEGEKGPKILYQSASSILTAKQVGEVKKLMKAEEVVVLK